MNDQQFKRSRGFLTKWQKGRPWLKTELATNGEVIRMYCDVCHKHPQKPAGPGKPNDTFIKGSTNFRLEAVIRHELSHVHQKAQEIFKDQGHCSLMSNSEEFEVATRKKHAAKNRGKTSKLKISEKKPNLLIQESNSTGVEMLRPLFRNAHAVALRGLRLSDYAWLCQLDEAKGLNLDLEYRNPESAQTIIRYIAEAEREKIKNTLQNSKFVSVIIDKMSSPDVDTGSSQEDVPIHELVYGRSVSEGHVTTHFVGRFVTKYPYDEQRIYNSVVKDILRPYMSPEGTDICCKIVGYGTNHHTAGTGKGAVLSVIKDVLQQQAPWVQGIHCQVAQLEDSARFVLANTTSYKRLHNLLTDVHNLYENPLNRVALKVVSFAKSSQHKTFKFVPPPDLRKFLEFGYQGVLEDVDESNVQTGWISCLLHVTDSLMGSYSEITQHCLQKSSGNTTETATMDRISKTLCDRNAMVFVQFVRDFLDILRQLLTALRDPVTSLLKSYIVTKAAVTKLKTTLNGGGKHLSHITQELTSLNGTFQGVTLIARDDVTLTDEIGQIVTSLCEMLDAGYHDISMEVLSATIIADLTQWPQSLQDDTGFGDDCVKILLSHFGSVLETVQVRLHLIEVEWSSLKLHLYHRHENPHNLKWSDIHHSVGKKFENIFALIDLILTLPVYSRIIRERGYQLAHQMNSDFRSKYNDALKSDILTTILHSGDVQSFNPDRAIEKFTQETEVKHCHDQSETSPASIGSRQLVGPVQKSDSDNSCHGDWGDESDDDVSNIHDVTIMKRPSENEEIISTLSTGNRRKEQGVRQRSPMTCHLCGAILTSLRSLRNHKLRDHKQSPHRCDVCGKCFQGKKALVEHYRCHSGGRPHACGVCGNRFRRTADLREHGRIHDTNRRRYQCPLCTKSFTQKIHLKYHQMSHTNNYRYYCDQCGKGFQMNCLLARHKIRAHTHAKPYKCTLCDKSFKMNRDLRIHSDSHDSSNNCICNQCGKLFLSRQLLDGHVMRMHETEKLPLECATCGKRFRHQTMLNAHERVHTGETPFQCHTCGKTFKQKGHLTSHTRTHTGEKPYRCALCDASFTVSCSLKKHMKYVHQGVKRSKNKSGARIPRETPTIEPYYVAADALRGAPVAMETLSSSHEGVHTYIHQVARHAVTSGHQMSPFSHVTSRTTSSTSTVFQMSLEDHTRSLGQPTDVQGSGSRLSITPPVGQSTDTGLTHRLYSNHQI